MFGQRFDLAKPGKFILVSIPRGKPVEDALLVVQADARLLGARCSELYFKEVNVTGTWADMAQPGGFHFDTRGAHDKKPKWENVGPVEFKVVNGHTEQGLPYLNFYVKHLGRAGEAVGGLLGEDDHTDEATPSELCKTTVSLAKDVGRSRNAGHASEAIASQ
jgi:hypothetical protein